MTQTTTDNVTAMKGLYEAFGRGEVPVVLGAMDEQIEWHEAEGNPWGTGAPFVGPQEVLEKVLARIGQEYERFRVEPHRFIGDGDTVVMEGRYKADRHQATGKPLDAEVVHIWDLRDGRIVRFHQYTDTRQMADVLGASAY
jgi:ketosteroid isomerase-like protein